MRPSRGLRSARAIVRTHRPWRSWLAMVVIVAVVSGALAAWAYQWDFAKAYLGSDRIGEVLLRQPNVRHVFCGHSHLAAEAEVGGVRAVNVGAGYRWKTYKTLTLE